MQVRKTLSTFCTEAKILLNEHDKKGIYKLVEDCKFLDSYVDMRTVTDTIVTRAEAGIKAIVKDVKRARKQQHMHVAAAAVQPPSAPSEDCTEERKKKKKPVAII